MSRSVKNSFTWEFDHDMALSALIPNLSDGLVLKCLIFIYRYPWQVNHTNQSCLKISKDRISTLQ